MSKPQSSRPTTRAKNAFSHPGAIVQKQKRRSREEMVQERAEKEAEVEKKTKRKLAGIARIAEIEERMAAKDSNAKLTPARPSHPLRRTSSHAFIPLIAPHSDGDGGETATSVPESDEVNSASDSDLVSTDVEKPPTKKSKTATSVRTAIEAAREGAANTRKVEGQGKHADKIVCDLLVIGRLCG